MTHPQLIETMKKADFYPHNPVEVEFIQTHISYVFIAGDIVYKVKKPVNFDFLDFTSLEKRKFYCEEELRLNKRLAPDTYLDVVAISRDSQGNITLGEGVEIIDYAVRMKKLPRGKNAQNTSFKRTGRRKNNGCRCRKNCLLFISRLKPANILMKWAAWKIFITITRKISPKQ